MNTKERLMKPLETSARAPMAARAVALCEGCPMAKFCVIKTVAPCETRVQQEAHIESGGGDFGGANLDKPVRTSYRDDLMDPLKPVVMAELQKKKEMMTPKLAKMASPTSLIVPQPKAVPSSPKKITLPTRPVKKLPTRENGDRTSDVLADILVSMFGVGSLATAHTKKSV